MIQIWHSIFLFVVHARSEFYHEGISIWLDFVSPSLMGNLLEKYLIGHKFHLIFLINFENFKFFLTCLI